MWTFEALHERTAHLHYEEKGLIIDTAEIILGKFETVAMSPSGREIEMRISYTLEQAEADFTELVKEYATMKQNEPKDEKGKPLTGKYAKLRDDLKRAFDATADLDKTEDGGTCNHDAPALTLPRWNADKVEQAVKEAGGRGAWKWNSYGNIRFVIGFPTSGQGNRRMRRSEAITKMLRDMGYDAFEYCAMD